MVNRERETRRISPSDSVERWTDLLKEVHELQPERRFNVELTGGQDDLARTEQIGALVSQGYSLECPSSSAPPVLAPRPSGVLYIVSPFADNIPNWIASVPADCFRQHLLVLNASEDTFALLASACAGESWHLDTFVRSAAWAEFIIEFVGSREIDVVQVINARLGVDLGPTLRSAYPRTQLVVDVGGEGLAWPTYVSSRYGNLVDAFFTSESDAVEALKASHISPARIRALGTDGHVNDDVIAAMHAELYGQLIAALVT
jgi:hypothetical protein